MVGRKKKTKICDKVSEKEDKISHLPEPLICEILSHLSTKDVVRTSVLSTKWRTLWQLVPGLDLDFDTFSNGEAFVSFVDMFLDSHRESWIHKLRLSFRFPFYHKSFLTRWVDAVTTRRIQHLDVDYIFPVEKIIPQSIYTCQALVHLRLCMVGLASADFVSLPCLKILHLQSTKYPDESTLQKLISGSPVLEDLTIIRCLSYAKVLLLRSHTLRRIYIDKSTKVVIDAPLLQCLTTRIYSTKNFQIISLGFFTKLDIDVISSEGANDSSLIHDILTDLLRFRDLVISNVIWKKIFQYSKSRPVLQFRDLSRLNTIFSKSDIEMLPTLLESCPKLESFILELVEDHLHMRGKKKEEPKVTFSTVPRCLVSSLKYMELTRSISGYEMELVRYFLKNSTILEKFRLNVYYTKNLLKEIVAMPRCSSACQVLVL